MKPLSIDERRMKFREQLLREWNAPDKPKKNKLTDGLSKKPSYKQKFLDNKNNRPAPGDKITYMTAMKKKPKEEKSKFYPL